MSQNAGQSKRQDSFLPHYPMSTAILLMVFAAIAVRQIGRVKLEIWQTMSLGAAAALITGQITPLNAIKAINVEVMLFLFGMFVVGEALEESRYLSHISYKWFQKARTTDQLVILILFGMGLLSSLLMNDTLAIIGTPVVLLLARKHDLPPKLLLLTLAFAITTGSAMSPIGNPQNLLIAGSIPNPFVSFIGALALPTILNLFATYALLKLFFREQFHAIPLTHSQEPIRDHHLAVLSKVSLILIILLVAGKTIASFSGAGADFRLSYIALLSALPILALSPKRVKIIRTLDWHTLIFFATMFVLMQSVWDSGFFQSLLSGKTQGIASNLTILTVSVLLSQLISNVPLVALCLPMLAHTGTSIEQMTALAAGSTIAGNLFILGAASNVIIIQNAEKRSRTTLTFLEFAKVGVPLTIVNIFVYWLFFLI